MLYSFRCGGGVAGVVYPFHVVTHLVDLGVEVGFAPRAGAPVDDLSGLHLQFEYDDFVHSERKSMLTKYQDRGKLHQEVSRNFVHRILSGGDVERVTIAKCLYVWDTSCLDKLVICSRCPAWVPIVVESLPGPVPVVAVGGGSESECDYCEDCTPTPPCAGGGPPPSGLPSAGDGGPPPSGMPSAGGGIAIVEEDDGQGGVDDFLSSWLADAMDAGLGDGTPSLVPSIEAEDSDSSGEGESCFQASSSSSSEGEVGVEDGGIRPDIDIAIDDFSAPPGVLPARADVDKLEVEWVDMKWVDRQVGYSSTRYLHACIHTYMHAYLHDAAEHVVSSE